MTPSSYIRPSGPLADKCARIRAERIVTGKIRDVSDAERRAAFARFGKGIAVPASPEPLPGPEPSVQASPPAPRPRHLNLDKAARFQRWQIIVICAAHACGVEPFQIASPRRPAQIVRARFIAARIMSARLGMSLPDIGRRIRRDHTSVLSALRRYDEWYRSSDAFRSAYDRADALVSEALAAKDAQEGRG